MSLPQPDAQGVSSRVTVKFSVNNLFFSSCIGPVFAVLYCHIRSKFGLLGKF
jgi:hypothetical protein